MSASSVVPGIYLLEFFAPDRVSAQLRVRIDEGEPPLRFRVPDPVKCRLWIIDESSGSDVAIDSILVSPMKPIGAAGRASALPIPERDAGGAFRLQLPLGKQTLSINLKDGRGLERDLDVDGSANELIVEIP